MRKKLMALLAATALATGLAATAATTASATVAQGAQHSSAQQATGNGRTWAAPLGAKKKVKASPSANRAKQLRVSATVSGVAWVFACDAKWYYSDTTDSLMKSTTCNTTRNGVNWPNLKMDAVRFYYAHSNGGGQLSLADYQFGGAQTTYDDTTAADCTHTEDDYMGIVQSTDILIMKVWGIPNTGIDRQDEVPLN